MQATASSIDKKCRKHMADQGITSKEKFQQRLQEVFEQAEHQDSVLVGLYKMLLPDWDRIERVEGFPLIGQEMWRYIWNLFIHFDEQHHPGCFKGGVWLNNGFSSSDKLGPWDVSLDRCNVIYS